MRYLLDTNILSDLVRNPLGAAASRLAQVGEQHVCTSIVAAGELRFGAVRKGAPRLTAQVEKLLDALDVLDLAPPADIVYANIRAALERQGRMIGGNDLLIAAHALSLDYTLVTDNVGEFGRVDGLKVENWLAPICSLRPTLKDV